MSISDSTKNFYSILLLVALTFMVNAGFGQTIMSDRPDYPPGDTAILTASGFSAGETVTLLVVHADEQGDNDSSEAHQPWEVMADNEGNFVTMWHVPFDEDEEGALLKATADGQSSGTHAEVLFTDATCIGPVVLTNPTGGTRCVGESISFTVTVTANGIGTLNYQWKKGGVNIPGATTSGSTSSTYTIPSVSSSNAGSYSVTVVRVGCTT